MKRPDTLSRVLHALFYVFLGLALAKTAGFIAWSWWAVTIPLWPNVLLFLAWTAAAVSDYRTAVRGESWTPAQTEGGDDE